ncbi:hypothetical protein Golob_018845 [Gossypium lobatum]|nr:hypothetical protein [Gossypium lobatum]
MIIEAISALKEPNGSDNRAIVGYIEQRQEVPQSFKKQLCSRLKRLVAIEKLEKVQNRYKIRKDETFGMKTTSPKQKGTKLKQSQNAGHTTCDAVEEASMTAAYLIAEAENKSFVAAEAVKEAERVSKMAEDADSLLQLAKEIFETCNVSATLHFFSSSRV